MATPELKTLGRYRIERVLGKGAMGVVYEGFDPRLSRRVAIKTILKTHLDEQTSADYSQRFVREAQAVARLNHPNIVQVHDFGEEGDVAYLVLEFIQGRELKSYFDANERFDLKETVRIMSDLCEALDFAHNAGIIHRDVKPGNVMLDSKSRVKLTDFGVARIQDVTKTHATEAGTMVGTPAYMSPEQISGGVVDRRTDIFAAGIILYQFLTGDLPFTGAGAWTVAKKIMQDQPALPSKVNTSISPIFDAVVNKALAKEPAKRYKSARDLEAALKRALEGKLDEDESDRTVLVSPEMIPPPPPPPPAPNVHPKGAKGAAAPSQSAAHSEMELEFWRAIKDGNDPEDFELYVQQFPTGTYTQLAKRKIAKLRGLDTTTRLTDSGLQSQTDLAKARAAEEAAKRQAEETAKREAEEKAKRAAEEAAKRQAEEKAKREAQAKAKREAEARARREAEEIAKHVEVMEREPAAAAPKGAPVAMLLGIGVVVVALAGGGAWYFMTSPSAPQPAKEAVRAPEPQAQPKPQQPAQQAVQQPAQQPAPQQVAKPAAPSTAEADKAAQARLEAERAAKLQAEKAAKAEAEKAAKLAAEKEAAEKALREAKAQNDKLAAQRAKEEAARIAAAKAAAEKEMADRLAAERAAAERAAAERAAAEKAAADKIAMEKAAAEQKERQLWESVRASSYPRDFDRYLNAYPSGQYAALARATQQKLENEIRLREGEAERRRMEEAHRRELEARERAAAQAAEAARQKQEAERKKSIFVPPTM
ncbi:MAG TPA: protein kinase [Burkholderiales bacterium]|nr:protein kinase [Burkholderiales bacterium]